MSWQKGEGGPSRPEPMNLNVAVIGGGMGGLAAAYELSKRGHKVHLLEKEAELGGQAGTFPIEGTRLEKFYHHLFVSDRDIIALIAELGLEERLQWRDSRVGFFHGGRVYDFVTPLDLLRFRPLPLLDRVRAGVLALYLQRLDNWQRFEHLTASDWLRRYGGQRLYDVIWGPQLRAKFGPSYGQVSMVWFWGKMKLRFGSRKRGFQRESLAYMKGSFQALTTELERRIASRGGRISRASPVERVLVEGGRVRGVRLAGGEALGFDRVIATVPSPTMLELVPEMPEGYARLLREAQYQAVLCLVLKLNRPLTHIYWLNISDPEIPFVAAIEHTNYIPPEVYGGKRVLYISNYLPADHQLYSLSREELLSEYEPYLRRINPEFNAGWVEESWLFRDPAGQPIITPGYSQRIPAHRTPIEGLYLANTTQIYPEDRGMNYSVRLGRKVAGMVLTQARAQ